LFRTLADEALGAVGANRALGYVFGASVELSQAAAGDVLHFRECIFSGPRADGATLTQTLAKDHVAVLTAAPASQILRILEQNMNGQRHVTSGLIWAFRQPGCLGVGWVFFFLLGVVSPMLYLVFQTPLMVLYPITCGLFHAGEYNLAHLQSGVVLAFRPSFPQ
jgi:hypothetical protein